MDLLLSSACLGTVYLGQSKIPWELLTTITSAKLFLIDWLSKAEAEQTTAFSCILISPCCYNWIYGVEDMYPSETSWCLITDVSIYRQVVSYYSLHSLCRERRKIDYLEKKGCIHYFLALRKCAYQSIKNKFYSVILMFKAMLFWRIDSP